MTNDTNLNELDQLDQEVLQLLNQARLQRAVLAQIKAELARLIQVVKT